MATHSFEKFGLLQTYKTVHKFNIIYLSESYVYSCISSDNNDLIIKCYNFVRDDHPDDVKSSGVCPYIRKFLPVRCLFNIFLKEYFILDVWIKNKKWYVISLYRSPSQATDEFDLFRFNLQKLLVDISNRNLHFVLSLFCDFNVKSRN